MSEEIKLSMSVYGSVDLITLEDMHRIPLTLTTIKILFESKIYFQKTCFRSGVTLSTNIINTILFYRLL